MQWGSTLNVELELELLSFPEACSRIQHQMGISGGFNKAKWVGATPEIHPGWILEKKIFL